jgi:tetratricopeptide (TPR) repeat protein
MIRRPKVVAISAGVLLFGLLGYGARASAQPAASGSLEPGKDLSQPAQAPAADAKPDPANVAAARALAQQGVRMAESGDCQGAIEKLERAEALFHAPIVAEQLASCYVSEGRLVEAIELYRAVLREPLPAQPSAAQRRAYERAERELAAQRPRLATLVVHVDGAYADDLTVLIDGKELPRALIGAERLSDPGEHHLVASASGHGAVTADVSLAPGERRELSLNLEPLPTAAGDAVAALPSPVALTPSAPVRDEPRPHGQALRASAYALWGAGALALGVGAGFGIDAMTKKGDLDDACDGASCPASERARIDSARRSGNVATAGVVVGAALAVTGTVLFVLGRRAPLQTARALPVSVSSDGRRTMATLHLAF